ncbi:tetratricopeptide repeat protein [Amphritea sp. HPY]|uniref:tetratricopeptide repeat protein n=1 Tax=Amphritea sp. HPY TaxID=3421652 RepID=UPI003D7EC306
MQINELKKIAFCTLPLLLSGCMATSGFMPPVEDRSVSGSTDRSAEQVVIDRRVHDDTAVTTAVAPVSSFSVASPKVAAPEPVAVSNPAVIALLDNARQQQSQGAYSSAQSSLERAQRIAPRDPKVYLQLADLRRIQGQYLQAEQLARKGLAVASDNRAMQRKLWLLIADIRQEGGDSRGAKDARQQAGRI